MSLTYRTEVAQTPTAVSRKKRATTAVEPQVKKIVLIHGLSLHLSLHGNEIFYPGQTIDIRWSYSNIEGTNES